MLNGTGKILGSALADCSMTDNNDLSHAIIKFLLFLVRLDVAYQHAKLDAHLFPITLAEILASWNTNLLVRQGICTRAVTKSLLSDLPRLAERHLPRAKLSSSLRCLRWQVEDSIA